MGSEAGDASFRQAVQRALLECEQRLGHIGFPQSHDRHLDVRLEVFRIAHEIVNAFDSFRLVNDGPEVADEFWDSFMAHVKKFDGGEDA